MAAAMANHRVTTDTDMDTGRAVVRVEGELDIAAVPEVRRAVADAEATGLDLLALDLAEVVHLDSSGLRVLLDAANRARERGQRLVIVAPPEGPVGRLLELTLLADHLDVVRDLGAALR
jgi:anti-sigma B factor antagonist